MNAKVAFDEHHDVRCSLYAIAELLVPHGYTVDIVHYVCIPSLCFYSILLTALASRESLTGAKSNSHFRGPRAAQRPSASSRTQSVAPALASSRSPGAGCFPSLRVLMRTLTLLRTHGITGRCVPRVPRPILLLPSLERPIQVKPLPVCDYKPVNEGTVDEKGEKKDEKKDENANVNGVASMSMNGKSVAGKLVPKRKDTLSAREIFAEA